MNNLLTNGVRAIFVVILGLVLGLSACSSPAPTVADTATVAQDQVLYSNRFDDEASVADWDQKTSANSQIEVKGGTYHFSVDQGEVASIRRIAAYADSIINVDFQFIGTAPAKAIVICRNNTKNYYFSISNSGQWKIDVSDRKLTGGETQALQPGVNKMTVGCIGNKLSLSLNDVDLGSIQDGELNQGSIGLALEADGKAEVAFDNLTVRSPAAQTAETVSTQVAAVEPASPTPTPIATDTPTLVPTSTATPLPTSTPSLVPTFAATLRPTPIPEADLSLYQTEFDDSDPTLADWKTFAYSMDKKTFVSEGYKTWTVSGVYRFRQETNIRVFAIYNKELNTADVDISTRGTAPYYEGGLGLVCRYSEAGWYQFMVEPNGIWSIRLAKPEENGQVHFHIISSGLRWLGQKVDLRAECKGDRLTFYMDGEKMASLHDATFPTGKVGLLGWSFNIPSDTNMIDNFTVQRAQWNETGLTGPAPTPGAEGTIYSTGFAKLDDLKPYWAKVDLGVQGIPGSPVLVGGPGQPSPHTYLHLNDFDPGPNVEITADVRGELNFPRGLICRYSEDGWYEAFYMKDSPQYTRVALARAERTEQGKLTFVIINTYYPPTPAAQINLTLTCAGNQISVKMNGEQVLYTEDNAWPTGRYGFLLTDNPPGNFRSNTLLNYTVRPAQAAKIGDVFYDETFDTPEKIVSALNLDLANDPRLKIQDNALLFTPGNNALHSVLNQKFENSEFTVDAEFLTAGGLNLHCRIESPSLIGAEIFQNGDWNLALNFDKILANGNSSAIQAGINQLTLSCVGPKITLKVNGETLTSVELPEYTSAQGTFGWDVYEGSQVKITKVTLKAFLSGALLTTQPLLNQVSIPPSYQPGEMIFNWDIQQVINGCKSGWWGLDPNPCLWPRLYRQEDWERSFQGNVVLVEGYDKYLTLFTYSPDLYDLPIEISAEASLTSKGGGVALFCRATANGRYEFYLQPDGKWFIRRNVISGYYLPQAKHLTVLAHGSVENFSPENMQLSATCSGSDLIFTLNGAELGRAQDTLYPEGQTGIFFDVFSEGSFTNLTIKRAK